MPTVICGHRVVTDAVADFLWTPSQDGNDNLAKEGVDPEKITLVGNIMIDSLVMAKKMIEKQQVYLRFGCRSGQYGLVTLHRPSNVDDPEVLKRLCESLAAISEKVPLIFPVHPRTVAKLEQFNIDLLSKAENIYLTDPLGYNEFMNLVFNCRLVITDSGGVQEETTYLQIPCLTLRPNTERPVTISQGTNRLCTSHDLAETVESIIEGRFVQGRIPALWDGNTAKRIVADIEKRLLQ